MSDPGWSGAVLVGGRSTRMGRDKALLEVGGQPMAARVAATLRAAGAAEVVVVGGADRVAGVGHVPDRFPGEGPMGGVITALRALDAPLVFVVACDLPWLDTTTVRAVVAGIGTADVAWARTERREPLCALWRRERALPVLEVAFNAGERALHRVVRLAAVEIAVDPRALTNVNTPADLAVVTGDGDTAG